MTTDDRRPTVGHVELLPVVGRRWSATEREVTLPIYNDLALARRTLLRRVGLDEIEAPPALLDANQRLFGARITPAEAVQRIIRDVRERGDAALRDWSSSTLR